MNTEPVLTAASIAGLISAGISFARLMGWIALSDDQFNSLMVFLGMALPVGLSVWARGQVTPVNKPRDTDGEILSRPDNTPALKELAALQTEAIAINKEVTAAPTDTTPTLGNMGG